MSPQSESVPAKPGPPPRTAPSEATRSEDVSGPQSDHQSEHQSSSLQLPQPASQGAAPRHGTAETSDHPTGPGESRWGRIAEDGTAYVRTSEGEREIGSWQAGDAAEGLAFFRRAYEDLKAQVDLLQQRVELGRVNPEEGQRKAAELAEAVRTAHAIGDLDALLSRLSGVVEKTEEGKALIEEQRARARTEAIARKTALVEEAESLATSTAWKTAGDRMRAILEEMKQVRGIDRATEQELWKRYQSARNEFSRHRGAHFAALDEARKDASERKEALIAKAEELADSTDWRATAAELKELMAEWKHLPRTGREAEEALWKRFRTAQDTFFRRRSEAYSAMESEYKEHLAEKERLLAEIEAIDLEANLEEARSKLRDLKGRWDDIGKVPREAMRPLDSRLRVLDDSVRRAQESAWQATRRAANPLAAQFREQIERLEAQAAKARAAGRTDEADRAEKAASTWRTSLAEAEKRSG